MVKKILFITLSNIGDVILTLPVLDVLRQNYPHSQITVVAGPRAKELFIANPLLYRVIIYDKRAALREKARFSVDVLKQRFDMVVDLRNSFLGRVIPAAYKSRLFFKVPRHIRHMKDKHLWMIGNLRLNTDKISRDSIFIGLEDQEQVENMLKDKGVEDNFIVVSPSAHSHIKVWPKENFVKLIDSVASTFKRKIILVGDKNDTAASRFIVDNTQNPPLDLTGMTNLRQLAYLIGKSALVIGNDSAILHMASYLDRPVIAVFGPTNENKYRPWSKINALAKKDIFCRPCEAAKCRFGSLKCMQLIKVDDVLRQVKKVLLTTYDLQPTTYGYKRILIVRTDRIGDVLLSTPVITALRKAYPDAYLAMMVSPYVKEIVEGNPYLDEVITYDKDGKHKSWQRTWRFALNLRKKKFDLALILHPTNRVHMITFLAGIKRRIGYDRKLGFLLTDRLKHTKQMGEKHELEYALDLVRYLCIEPEDKNLVIPMREEAQAKADMILKDEGISFKDRLVAIHPGASCISKLWPLERFAQLADRLIEKYGVTILILCGSKDTSKAETMLKGMHHRAINLAGKTSVSQLAGIIKRCQLFISNDSGPVHIASGVGTPVISIFGRSQKGLSPTRWGPVGRNDRVAHQTVGCVECLAHNCVRDFICLKAVTVDYVLNLADSMFQIRIGTGGKEDK